MQYIGDKSIDKHRRLMHKQGCPILKDIPYENTKTYGISKAERKQYLICPFCDGIDGYIRCHKTEFGNFAKKGAEYYIIESPDRQTLYIRTANGFWQIYTNPDNTYRLKHRNKFSPDMAWDKLMAGQFRNQSDCKPNISLIEIMNYIIKHDQAKMILHTKGYQYLPKDSKKQKDYYRSAKNKAKRQEKKRLYWLLNHVND